MSASVPPSIAPKRILYTMLRVSDLDRSIAFYRDRLGMSELGRETFPDAKFTAVFMGYGNRKTDAVIELTYNWGNHSYEHGTRYGNLSLAVDDIYALETYLKENGVEILRPAGEIPMVSTETGEKHTLAFIADPDGYRIELMQTV
ncbi:VOC family protein [Acaryochloris marina NIES-2412]|uniref:VOC family protein n=1 Tax=Acaryochloris marina TaxID=155978 RepID=UPI004059B22B